MSLYAPPSLNRSIIDRSWIDSNGEIGLLPPDVDAFLDACEREKVPVLGWEMWLIDHCWDERSGAEPAKGQWTGLIPSIDGQTCVWSGEGDAAVTRSDIARLEWRSEVPQELHPYVRFNVTLDV